MTITSLGWSRRIDNRISVGVESIGQDLEGLWNPAEADGGAKLLVGPSFHAYSKGGDWSTSVIAGPVVRTPRSCHRPTSPLRRTKALADTSAFLRL